MLMIKGVKKSILGGVTFFTRVRFEINYYKNNAFYNVVHLEIHGNIFIIFFMNINLSSFVIKYINKI